MSGEKGTSCIDRNLRDDREKKKDVQQKCSGWMFLFVCMVFDLVCCYAGERVEFLV